MARISVPTMQLAQKGRAASVQDVHTPLQSETVIAGIGSDWLGIVLSPSVSQRWMDVEGKHVVIVGLRRGTHKDRVPPIKGWGRPLKSQTVLNFNPLQSEQFPLWLHVSLFSAIPKTYPAIRKTGGRQWQT